MKIEGIPEGWQLVRIGKVKPGEIRVDSEGNPAEWNSVESTSVNYAIIRKIEKPKQFRPFANAAEFEPHRDRWFRVKMQPGHTIRTSAYDDRRHWSGEECDTWEKMFADYEFEDGTPFGVEVTE